jgi:hypothetical protein
MAHRRERASVLARAGVGAIALAGLSGLVACGSDGDSSDSFCAALRSAPTLETVISGFTSVDPGELTRRLDRASTAYATVARTAPDDIDADVDAVVVVVDAVIEAVRANTDDPTAAAAALRAAIENEPDLSGAAVRVATYAKDECDLDLNPGITPDSTTTPPPTGSTRPPSTTAAGD